MREQNLPVDMQEAEGEEPESTKKTCSGRKSKAETFPRHSGRRAFVSRSGALRKRSMVM